MKRLLTPLTLALLGLSLGLSQAQQQAQQEVTLEMWTLALSPTFDDYINSVVAGFEEAHSTDEQTVRVNWIDLPDGGFPDRFFTAIAAGQAPDVVNLNTARMLQAVSQDALLNLSEAATPEQLGIYFDGLLESSSYAGNIYALPWYQAPTVLMYNRAIFEEAGLDPDAPPTTWDEVFEMALAIREATFLEGIAPLPFPENWLPLNGVQMLSDDLSTATFDTPEGVAAVQTFVDLMESGAVSRDAVNFDYQKAIGDFAGGQVAMLVTGPQFLRTVESDGPDVYANLGIAPYPEASNPIIPNAIQNMVVPAASDQPELAVALANWVTNDANQLEFSQLVSIFPSTQEAAQDPFFCEDEESLEGQARCIQSQSIERSLDVTIPENVRDELRRGFQAAMLGQMSAEEALADAQARTQALLDR